MVRPSYFVSGHFKLTLFQQLIGQAALNGNQAFSNGFGHFRALSVYQLYPVFNHPDAESKSRHAIHRIHFGEAGRAALLTIQFDQWLVHIAKTGVKRNAEHDVHVLASPQDRIKLANLLHDIPADNQGLHHDSMGEPAENLGSGVEDSVRLRKDQSSHLHGRQRSVPAVLGVSNACPTLRVSEQNQKLLLQFLRLPEIVRVIISHPFGRDMSEPFVQRNTLSAIFLPQIKKAFPPRRVLKRKRFDYLRCMIRRTVIHYNYQNRRKGLAKHANEGRRQLIRSIIRGNDYRNWRWSRHDNSGERFVDLRSGLI